jgi:hypothetical protein
VSYSGTPRSETKSRISGLLRIDEYEFSLTDTPGREGSCLSQELGFHPQLPDLTLKLAQARSL